MRFTIKPSKNHKALIVVDETGDVHACTDPEELWATVLDLLEVEAVKQAAKDHVEEKQDAEPERDAEREFRGFVNPGPISEPSKHDGRKRRTDKGAKKADPTVVEAEVIEPEEIPPSRPHARTSVSDDDARHDAQAHILGKVAGALLDGDHDGMESEIITRGVSGLFRGLRAASFRGKDLHAGRRKGKG